MRPGRARAGLEGKVLQFEAGTESNIQTAEDALHGLALAATVAGDQAEAPAAWERLAAGPALPPALQEEVERQRGD